MKKSVYKIDNGLTRKRENLLKHLVIYVIDMIAAVRISILRAGITRFVIHCPPSELPKRCTNPLAVQKGFIHKIYSVYE